MSIFKKYYGTIIFYEFYTPFLFFKFSITNRNVQLIEEKRNLHFDNIIRRQINQIDVLELEKAVVITFYEFQKLRVFIS